MVGYVVDRAGARTDAQAPEVGEKSVRTRALTPAVREVVRGILQATDTADARVLLGQLMVAQESFFDDGVEGFSTTVEFQVSDDVVRVVPNHVCIVVHRNDVGHGFRGETVERSWPVDARGRGAMPTVV